MTPQGIANMQDEDTMSQEQFIKEMQTRVDQYDAGNTDATTKASAQIAYNAFDLLTKPKFDKLDGKVDRLLEHFKLS